MPARPLPTRLARLPLLPLHPPLLHVRARLAATPRARLLGLVRLDAEALTGTDAHAHAYSPTALLLPRTRSVHTFGMRLALDLVWLDRAGRALRIDRDVPPRRLRGCRSAAAVLELPAGAAAPLRPGSRVV